MAKPAPRGRHHDDDDDVDYHYLDASSHYYQDPDPYSHHTGRYLASTGPPAYSSHHYPQDDYDHQEYLEDRHSHHRHDAGALGSGSTTTAYRPAGQRGAYRRTSGMTADGRDSGEHSLDDVTEVNTPRIAGNHLTAGRGAGINAYRRGSEAPPSVLDTPSMYTDPHEYQSTAGHTAMTTTPNLNHVLSVNRGARRGTADNHFLDVDPYYEEDTDVPRGGADGLRRNDTLMPGDSVSAYNVPAPQPRDRSSIQGPHQTRNSVYGEAYTAPSAEGYPSERQPAAPYGMPYDDRYNGVEDEDGYRTYHRGANGDMHGQYTSAATEPGPYDYYDQQKYFSAASGAAYPMGYAEDEYDHDRQLKAHDYYDAPHGGYGSQDAHEQMPPPPGLFANQMADVGGYDPQQHGKHQQSAYEDVGKGGSKRGLLGFQTDSLDVQVEKRRRGIGRQKWPVVTWIFAIAFVAVFIVELIKAKAATGQAIQTKPSINPMIGPSTEFQIAFGARYVPCMRETPAVPLTTSLVCLNATTKSSYSSSDICPLWQICGLPDAQTYGQQYRLITPMFLHAGVVHILFNLVVQLTLCAQIEKLLGSFFYTIIYVLAGLGGNLLGGNFGLVASPSVGASGAIYGCIAIELVDLVYNWQYEYRAKTRLILSILFTLLGLGLGLLPGLDNFAHIGGLAVGLLGGMIFAPSIHETRRHRAIVWVLRFVAAGLLAGYFVGLALNFYRSEDPTAACKWCRYLSCLPTFKQCQNGGLTTTSSSTTSRRDWSLL